MAKAAWAGKFYQPLSYDPADENSVIEFAGFLAQKRLGDKLQFWPINKAIGKGQFGNVLEEFYFYKKVDSLSEPDFPCGIELKSAPLRTLATAALSVKERVSLSMINYLDLPKETFASSTFLKKNSRILLVFYLYKKNQSPTDAFIQEVYFWQIPPEDIPVIEADWMLIHRTVTNNNSADLSEGQTRYVGACTKGAGRGQVRLQADKTLAKPRAFSLKRSYVQYIYKRYVLNEATAAPIVNPKTKKPRLFEEVIQDAFKKFYGLTAFEIADKLEIKMNPIAKNFNAAITKRLFKIQPHLEIEEFQKAGIKSKTIRVEKNGIPPEHVSFPYFKPTELVQETWEQSALVEHLSVRFFFVIYVEDDDGKYRLRGTRFWAVPKSDLDGPIKNVWLETRKRLNSLQKVAMPGQAFNHIAHVRPHGDDKSDALPTPGGWYLTRPCFWLDARYLSEALSLPQLIPPKNKSAR